MKKYNYSGILKKAMITPKCWKKTTITLEFNKKLQLPRNIEKTKISLKYWKKKLQLFRNIEKKKNNNKFFDIVKKLQLLRNIKKENYNYSVIL